MSTCFWTDLVGTQQVCPEVVVPPEPEGFSLDNFLFAPVVNADSVYTVRASNSAFSEWRAPGAADSFGEDFMIDSNFSGPGLSLFTGPGGVLFREYAWSGYLYLIGPFAGQFVYSNGFSYNGTGAPEDVGTTGGAPYIRHPNFVASTGTRWWSVAAGNRNTLMYADGAGWEFATNFPADLIPIAATARSGIVASVCISQFDPINTLVWSTDDGDTWNTLTLAAGPVHTLAIAMSPTQVYRAAGVGNTNAQFSNTTALGTASNVGGTFPKRRAWWTGASWLVERLSNPIQIQRYTDLATAGTSVFSFPAGTTPCGSFLEIGGGKIVVPVLLSSPANHADFYVSVDDGVTFNLVPGMRLDIGDSTVTNYSHGFNITYVPPV